MLIPATPHTSRPAQAPLPPTVVPVARVAELAGVADLAETPHQLLASLAGRSVSALVVGRADDGHGIVEIAGRRLTIAAELPAPGTQVTLRFAGPQNALAGGAAVSAASAASAAAASATTLARLDPAARSVASAATDGKTGGVLVELGEGARSLGRFAETPLEPLALGRVDAPIDSPGEWSAALAKLLRDSGTFYESHLAAWTRGRYPLDDIRREPQAGGSATPALPGTRPQAALPGPALPDPASAAAARLESPAAAQPATQAAQEAARGAAPQTLAAGGVPEEHHAVIREQLHALETQTLPVSVEAWPGQRAGLEIGREAPDASAPGADAVPGWKSSLTLRLPALGEVNATLTLKGDRLWLDLTAPAQSARALDAADTSLAQALHAAGVRLVRARIREGDEDGPA